MLKILSFNEELPTIIKSSSTNICSKIKINIITLSYTFTTTLFLRKIQLLSFSKLIIVCISLLHFILCFSC